MAAGGKEMEIAIKIAGKVESSFKSAIGAATKGLGSIAKAVSAATAAAAAAVGALGVAAVNVGKEFETAMSQVAATMLLDKTTEEGQKAFETLENAARECGASTAFSATEAAEALNYLALAGYDAEKAAAALPTVLKLAGAGAMELGQASDMVTDSMSALGIEATKANLTQFSDQLAKTASKSNTSVSQLGEAILTVGGTAQGLAGGTTELNTALGILADNGIKAAEGGTHLRNMILSLQNARNSDAAALFEKMGLSAYDTEGKMRNLGDIFGDFNASLAGASAQDVNNTLATIFNQTDLASARAMLAATTDSVESLGAVLDASLADSGTSVAGLGINLQEMVAGFDKATTQEQFAAQMLEQFGMAGEQAGVLFNGLQSIVNGTGNRFMELSQEIENSAGACEDMYAIQLDNLKGDMDILKSGLADLGISVYKDLNGPLREMTQLATSMVGELSDAYREGGMDGMVGVVGGCLSEVVNTIAEYAPQVVSMGVDLLENFINGITDNSDTLAAAAADVGAVFINGLFSLVPQVILAGIDIIVQLAQSITAQLPQLINNGTQAIVNFVGGIIQRLPEVISTALTLVQTLVNSIGQNAPMLINAAIQLIGNLVLGIVSMIPQLIQMGIQLILSLVQGIISNLPQVLQMGVDIIRNLVSGIVQAVPMVIQSGIQLIISLIQGLIANYGNIIQAAWEIVGALAGGLIQAIPQILTAGVQLLGALIEMIFTTNWLQVGIDIIKSIINGIVSTGKSLWEAIKSLFTDGEVDIPDMTGAFSSMDTSAVAAGTAAGTAFSESLTGSMASSGLDVTAFTTSMTTMGTTGAEAFNVSFNAGLAVPIDTGGFLNTGAISSNMTTAGTQAATAFTTGLSATMTMAVNQAGMAIGTGIAGNSQAAAQAAVTLENDVNTALDSGWNKANTNAQTAMQRLTMTVTDAARSAANAVKAAFENMTITIPKPKLPVISVSENFVSYGDGGSASVPNFSVSWNALGGIFDQPTIFNTPAGLQGVGEAGPEAVLPLDTLWAKMKEILNEAIATRGGASLIDAFIEKLKGIGTEGGGQGTPELAGAGGPTIQYSPVYNLYGSAGKNEIAEADKLSQAEFNKLMKQYERDQQRRKL